MKHLRTLAWMYLLSCVAFLALHCSAADSGAFAYRLRNEYTLPNGTKPSPGEATCFAIDKHTLVTAAHAVQGADEVLVDHEIGWLRCRIVKVDAKTDLALLECKSADFHSVALDMVAVLTGDAIRIYGSPDGGAIHKYVGAVCKLWATFDNAGPKFETTCAIVPGVSGSPVIRGEKCVGVVQLSDKADGAAICCPSVAITAFLRDDPTLTGEIIPPPRDAKIADNSGKSANILIGRDDEPQNPIGENRGSTTLSKPNIPDAYRAVPAPIVCTHCRSVTATGRAATAIDTRSVHWEADVDHGQGGWVRD